MGQRYVISEKEVKVAFGESGIACISSSEFFVHRVSEVDAKSALEEFLGLSRVIGGTRHP